MATVEPAFTIGVEEEYLLIHPETRDLEVDPPQGLLEACEERIGGQVSPEFMRCQIEVGTPVCTSVSEARDEVARLRSTVSEVARAHDLDMIASSTHPFASWLPQKTTHRQRYEQLEQDIGVPARRLLICAMHVHVGIEDENLRIDLMNQMRYFLPHLLALSTSSPFWQGEKTGLKSYRLAVFSELPRTGMPNEYESWGEYQKELDSLVGCGVLEDATKLWWDIRPSARFPTLEMRICDICTRIDDTMALVALYVCLLRMLWRLKRTNVRWRRYSNLLINENRWRAMRYGLDAGMIDFGRGEMVDYPELLAEILDLVAEDADALGCADHVGRARAILEHKTSAHNQLRIHDEAVAEGASRETALRRVVDWLVEQTRVGCT